MDVSGISLREERTELAALNSDTVAKLIGDMAMVLSIEVCSRGGPQAAAVPSPVAAGFCSLSFRWRERQRRRA